MPLIKDARLAHDAWIAVGDDEALPEAAPIIVSFARWQRDREVLVSRQVPLGVRLRSDQQPAIIADDLHRFGVIALEFPKFTDGRAYSSARLLRERYRYAGELRAVGNVLRDQLHFMHRCGFDAFEIPATAPADAWVRALRGLSVVYQPAADGRTPTLALRHARREPSRRPGDDAEHPYAAASALIAAHRDPAAVCAAVWAY
jgi:uncharacterized protein (DUF934 family)